MTQAVNLANFSNSLDSSGGVAPSALNAAVPYSKGGTNATTQATAQANMGVMTGEIKMWGIATAPTGYLLCNGTAVSRSTYAALFALYGVTFGAGDGSTTFNLPDFRDRMPIGAGTTYSANSFGGSNDAIVISHSHTATSSVTDPTHSHNKTWSTPNDFNRGSLPAGIVWSPDDQSYGYQTISTDAASTGISVSTSISTTGATGVNANLPPYRGIYFIIKT